MRLRSSLFVDETIIPMHIHAISAWWNLLPFHSGTMPMNHPRKELAAHRLALVSHKTCLNSAVVGMGVSFGKA